MKTMRIKSGEYNHGLCGLPTGLFDTAGTELFTGDIVAIGSLHNWNENCFFGFQGLCVVVSDCEMEHQSDNSCFVMGIKSEHHSFIDGDPAAPGHPDADYNFSSVTQNHEQWVLQKVKSWQDVAHMEKVDHIRFYDESQS